VRQPTIEWQTNGVCNYDCSYCIQSKKFRQGQPSEAALAGFLSFFGTLPGVWEIKMSGGEPFATRGFLETIIPGLAKLPHRVSVLTNLSAPLKSLRRFVDLVGDKLHVISASLHLEFTTADEFISKAAQLRAWLRPETSLVINSVLVPGKLEELPEIRARIEAAGLRYFPQWMKTKHGTYDYSPGDLVQVRRLTGEAPTPREANLAPSYKGRNCYAGVEYLVLEQNGDAWTCRTAKRFRQGFLGNVLQGGVTRLLAPSPCPYEICPCTVPANRGMIEGIGG
jgi:MoaA/NifB/PqqE/SkfB family radical SAM enzyme